VDGSTSTRWSSAYSDPQWLQVDLGATNTIGRVVLRWEAAYGKSYQIQTSNDATNWTNIYSTTAGDGGVDDITVSGSGRYVRMYGTVRATTWGYSLWELEVYASGSGPTSTPGPTATKTNTPSAPTNTPTRTRTPTPGPTTPPGSKMSAPYIDVSPGSGSAIMQLASNGSGNKHYTLAFILGRGCSASWFGTFEMNTAEADAIGTRINELRAAGGDVIISFGGAAAPELADVCPDAASLQAQYQAVVTKYHPYAVDMDIEDFPPTAIDNRNKALKGLEAANPGLRVHYTLGVLETGFTQPQMDVLNNARTNGTRVDLVNIMAMDYGHAVSDMYAAAVSAAQGSRSWMNSNGFSSAQLGITPMIGVNDSAGETFTLANATSLASWSNSNGVTLLAFWSVGRDNGGCPGGGAASPSCSGISQSNFQFSSIFHGFAN
jgi:chitinase